jgi:hypothetical protein
MLLTAGASCAIDGEFCWPSVARATKSVKLCHPWREFVSPPFPRGNKPHRSFASMAHVWQPHPTFVSPISRQRDKFRHRWRTLLAECWPGATNLTIPSPSMANWWHLHPHLSHPFLARDKLSHRWRVFCFPTVSPGQRTSLFPSHRWDTGGSFTHVCLTPFLAGETSCAIDGASLFPHCFPRATRRRQGGGSRAGIARRWRGSGPLVTNGDPLNKSSFADRQVDGGRDLPADVLGLRQ